MQYTEVASCSTMSPFSSSTRRPSESPNSAASTSDETSSQHQNFVWKPFMGSVVTRKIPKDHCGITSEDFTVTYSNSLRRQLVTVKMQKSLLFEEQRGIWKWFKTWRLPEIRVVVNEQQSFSPSFVRLSVVCPTQRVHVFEEVGLLGRTQAQLVNGECKFTRQRFIATSSSYEGRNFHFFISFFSPTGCCLGALISTGFVVYARGPNTASFQEGIRFSQLMKAQKLWFPPELLMRPFVKKVRNEEGAIESEPIENSVTGLMRYFQAPNIRFKCRDPIFLAMRFSNVIVLLVRSSVPPSQRRDTYHKLFLRLSQYRCSRTSSLVTKDHVTQSSCTEVVPLCLFGLCNNDALSENVRAMLYDNMESCQDETVRFVRDMSVLPSNFFEVTNITQFREAYEHFFSWYTNIFLVSKQAKESCSFDCSETLEDLNYPNFSDLNGLEDKSFLSEPFLTASIERRVPCTSEASELLCPSSLDVRSGSVTEMFVNWFKQFHSLLRKLLQELTIAASRLVMNFDETNKSYFNDCFRNFQRALTLHTRIEDGYGFAELMKERPLIFEAYRIDHTAEEEEMMQIVNLSTNMQIENVGELFIRISSFSSLLCRHMEKEENHLLPCAVQLLSATKLEGLVAKMNEESLCMEGWKNLSTIS